MAFGQMRRCKVSTTNQYPFKTIRDTFFVLLMVVAYSSNAEERIWLKAKINDKPVHLCFDSGSGTSALFPAAVKRLGLKFVPAPTNDNSHGVLAGDTEDCTLTLYGTDCKMSFRVLDLPAYVNSDIDGLIGWDIFSPNVLRIDAVAKEVTPLSKVPKQATLWAQFSILALTNSGTLDLQIPHSDSSKGVLCVDTGDFHGLALPEPEWHRWKEAHPHAPITLDTEFTFSGGFSVIEEAWAGQISVGPMALAGVPVTGPNTLGATRWGARYEGTLGLAALKRLDFIADGKNGVAYLRAKKTRPTAYTHNRLGAVFVPTATQTNQGVAKVVTGSPAYDAGVRDGDVLLRVDNIVVKGWNSGWRNCFYLPAGTRLKLTLKRDEKIFTTTATLREILGPGSNKSE